MWTNKVGKYNNRKTEYKGELYDSKREVEEAMYLDSEQAAGRIKNWQKQVTVPLFGQNKTKVCTVIVDFLIWHHNGIFEYLEIKSPATKTSAWRIKWKLLIDNYRFDERYKFTVRL